MSFLRTLVNSSVIVHPPGFYIIGFQSFASANVFFIFLAFVYVVTVLFNGLLIIIVVINPSLHTPKFLAVINLAVVDLCFTTCTIPGMIKTFLFKVNFVPFNSCLVQMYFYYVFAPLESYALMILAYDRLVAICFALRHNSINTIRSMCCIISITWCYNLGATAYSVSLMTRLSFCNSVTVFSYFCDYAPVYRLACNDNSMQWFAGTFFSYLNILVPLSFIVVSYISILLTVFKMKTNRVKTLATCAEHIILVAVFYIPFFVIYTLGFYLGPVNPDLRVLCLSLASCLPPCINPIVYSLKTKEIKTRALALIRQSKRSVPTNSERIIVVLKTRK
ncbi:olfactory receptor 1496-like [Oryzias melastigma]|uniref:olfactory receptor 1496-like n=1 Tax=Oryzias melastigma TaxID=30732 RepID=UPI000CF7BBA2|nr:olfactory receptor 1496-like [Oryzias melastigma]XP_024121744.1 olfactory receptor 1496-like [Oryzias melastigma]